MWEKPCGGPGSGRCALVDSYRGCHLRPGRGRIHPQRGLFRVRGSALFSFHSIPLKDIEAGDTYELQTGATSLAVAGELGLDRRSWTISYQSRFDKGRTWLSPFTRPTLERLAQAAEPGSRLFMVCPNFSVDCLETLYDVPYELEPLYRAALAGLEVNASEEPGALENTRRLTCDGPMPTGRHAPSRRAADDSVAAPPPALEDRPSSTSPA
ncbi:MAG: ferrochelatase [Adlercreutzia sp.]